MNIKDGVLNRETYKINISYEVPKNYHLKPNCKYTIYYEDTDEDYIPESGDALSDLIQDAIKELDENGNDWFNTATIVEINLRTENETVLADLLWEAKDWSLTNAQELELKRYSDQYGYDWVEINDGLNWRIRMVQMTIPQAIEDVKETMAAGDSLYESFNQLKDFQDCHKKKQKGLSPFSYLNPNAGDVEAGNEFFNNATTPNTSSSGEGIGEDLDTAQDSNFKVIKYNKYLYAILDKAKNILVRKREYLNDPQAYKYAYDNKGKAYFFTTKDKNEAEAYANDLQTDYDAALNESLDQCKITYKYVLDDTLDDDEAIDYIKSDLEKYNLNLDSFKIDTKFTADKNIHTIICGQRKNIEKWLEDRIYQDYNLDKSSRIYKNYINNITEAIENTTLIGESMKEDFRVWGDEEISAQNDLVKWEQALEDFLENNNIEYDQVKCDVFDYGTNIVIMNPKDIEEVAQEIEDHYGFKTTIEDNNIYVDVTEEYEDEYGDIKTRVAKRYHESYNDEGYTLQYLNDKNEIISSKQINNPLQATKLFKQALDNGENVSLIDNETGEEIEEQEIDNYLLQVGDDDDEYDYDSNFEEDFDSNTFDIRHELNKLDFQNYGDLLNMYDSIDLSNHEKQRIAELIVKKDRKALTDYLQELVDVQMNVYDGNGNGIVTNEEEE